MYRSGEHSLSLSLGDRGGLGLGFRLVNLDARRRFGQALFGCCRHTSSELCDQSRTQQVAHSSSLELSKLGLDGLLVVGGDPACQQIVDFLGGWASSTAHGRTR